MTNFPVPLDPATRGVWGPQILDAMDHKLTPRSAMFRSPVPAKSMVSILANGHGWVGVGAGTFTANDAADYCLGTQSAKIVTNGAGSVCAMDKTGLALDLTGKHFVLWVKTSSLANLAQLIFIASNAGFTAYRSWQVNLASLNDPYQPLQANTWTQVALPWAHAVQVVGALSRNNVQSLRLYAVDRNGQPVTVRLNGVATMPESATWPNGVITLTFDDSYASAFTEAKPYMDKYGYAGTAFPIIGQVGGAGAVTLTQLKQMRDLSGWEIAGHATDLATHNASIVSLTAEQRRQEFAAIRQWMTANGFQSDAFAYPGALGYDQASIAEVAEFFSCSFTAAAALVEAPTPLMPYQIARWNSGSAGGGLAIAQAVVDIAKGSKAWGVLEFHDLIAVGGTPNDMTPANFHTLIDYINAQGVPVRTVREVLSA